MNSDEPRRKAFATDVASKQHVRCTCTCPKLKLAQSSATCGHHDTIVSMVTNQRYGLCGDATDCIFDHKRHMCSFYKAIDFFYQIAMVEKQHRCERVPCTIQFAMELPSSTRFEQHKIASQLKLPARWPQRSESRCVLSARILRRKSKTNMARNTIHIRHISNTKLCKTKLKTTGKLQVLREFNPSWHNWCPL